MGRRRTSDEVKRGRERQRSFWVFSKRCDHASGRKVVVRKETERQRRVVKSFLFILIGLYFVDQN